MPEHFEVEELVAAESMAAECSSGGCCLASAEPEPFEVEELLPEDSAAAECSSGGCCLASAELED